MPQRAGSYFHLHLVSDATGETLTTVARAATAQYTKVLPVEHVYPLVRTQKQLDRVLAEIEEAPGIVLYTLLDDELVARLEKHCRELGLPCLSILGPVLQLLQSYLGTETSHRVGAQHMLNAEYFKRIDALNYTMLHDDGQHLDGLEEADVVLVGRIAHVEDADLDLSRQPRREDRQCTAGARNCSASPRRRAVAAAGGRALCQPGAHRADPAESPARPQGASRRRPVYRPQGGGGGGGVLAQAVRPAQLAEHRRHAPLDRGDRGGGHELLAERRRQPVRERCRSGLPISRWCSRRRARSGVRFCAPPEFRSKSIPPTSTSGRSSKGVRRAIAGEIAALLAREKALAVAAQLPGRLVLGADQTLALGERRFSKPADRAAAREQLKLLRGQTHELHSAIALARDGVIVFEHREVARLTMRAFSDGFLEAYLDAAGAAVTASVGGYQLEKTGIQLFERIEGDHFIILGLPLLPLLHICGGGMVAA